MSSSGDQLIAIQRNQSALRAVVSRIFPLSGECKLVSLPLANVDKKLFAERDRYASNWQKLAKCDVRSLDTLMVAMEFLTTTVQSYLEPGPMARSLVSVLKPEVEVRATKANPRAYKGTKKKPPKQSQSSEIDLRPYLCNWKLTQELIIFWQSEFKDYFDEMEWRDDLFGAGVEPHYWPRVVDGNIEIESLPSKFKDNILPCLSEMNSDSISTCCKLYWHLDLENEPSVMALFVRILFLSELPPAVMLANQLMSLDPSECVNVMKRVAQLLEGEDWKLVLEEGVLEEVRHLSNDADFIDNLSFVLEAMSDGFPFDYLKILVRMKQNYQDVLPAYSNNLRYSSKPAPLLEAEKFPGNELDLFLSSLAECELEHYDQRWPEGPSWYLGYLLWKGFATHPKLVNYFKQVPWKTLHPCVAQSIALYFQHASYGHNEAMVAFASLIESHLASLLEKIVGFEDFEVQIAFVEEVRSIAFDIEESDRLNVEQIINLVERCKSLVGASESNAGSLFLYLLNELSDDRKELVSNLPDSTLKEMCRASRRENDARMIRSGLNTLARIIPDLVLAGLRDFPGKLLKVAKLYGCMNVDLREAIIKEFQNSPVFKLDESRIKEKRLLDVVALLVKHNCASQIPKKLKQHLNGEIKLTDNQLERALNLAQEGLVISKIEFLEQFTYERMLPGVSVDAFSEKIQHALKIMHQNTDSKNYRSFRKFLNRYMAGDHDYLLAHPRNLEWVSKKDSINLEYWIEGCEKHYENEKITLRLETDPFEALKLGTHVGSCFGSGGSHSHCAMAAVMDINKQVVYALDAKNNVIARQILAISDEGKLLKFSIYPEGACEKYGKLFADFDDHLASLLNVQVHTDDSYDSYSVANLISVSWYDDGLYIDDDYESKKKPELVT